MSPQSSESLSPGRLPEALDARRMVAARRSFKGVLSLSAMPRLLGMLHEGASHEGLGEARYAIEFDRDALKLAYVELQVEAALPLLCQRSLQRFELPVRLFQRLALLDEGGQDKPGESLEALEAGLPPDYEPLQLPEDGMLRPLELIEDELILAIPAVPVSPGSQAVAQDWPVPEQEAAQANPFAALAGLKKH